MKKKKKLHILYVSRSITMTIDHRQRDILTSCRPSRPTTLELFRLHVENIKKK